MTLTITSLRVDFRKTEGWFDPDDCPYIIVNCCFKVDRNDPDWSHAWDFAKAETEDYKEVLTVDDPKRYLDWIMSDEGWWDFSSTYDGYGKAWTHHECPWRYVEKFDTFWLREWVCDSTVTRAIIAELAHYKTHGTLPSVYRTVESQIVMQHLRTLSEYWD